MGILSIFGKKDTTNKENLLKEEAEEMVKEENKTPEPVIEKEEVEADNKADESKGEVKAFAFGVQDAFPMTNSKNVVVIGRVKGTIRVDDEVVITNVGDDKKSSFKSKVIGMEINKTQVPHATDCLVVLNIENGADANLKRGSVIYSENASNDLMHATYINALGDMYVLHMNFKFEDKDIENMSITDCAEAWKLYGWYISKNKLAETEEQKADYKKKTEVIIKAMCDKILAAEEIYCVCNTLTGEPHLFSKTIKQEQGFLCTPPEVVLIPAAYADVYRERYSKGDFELRKIVNGSDGKGIRKFLMDAFYIDGACGASIISDMTGVAAERLVEKPDYEERKGGDLPVTNPGLERWILLLTQLGQPKTEEDEIIYKLYFRFMSNEIFNAKLLVPVLTKGKIPAPNQSGVSVIKEDMKISFSTLTSKDGRDAVRMYTDFKKFRAEFTSEWAAMIGPMSDMIEYFDCALNMSKTYKAGCYINKEMYKEMKDISQWEKH